jgi:outer membrane protein OmpA-like peptidoglycan-associated protein
MDFRITAARKTVLLTAAVALLAASPALGRAQARSTASLPPPEPSRVDIFTGFSYLHPIASDINGITYQTIPRGTTDSVTGYFTRSFGLQVEGSYFPNSPDDQVQSIQAGPAFRLPRGRFVPFAHLLFGGSRVSGPAAQPYTWGYGATGGIGIDYILPAFGNHIAIRPIQADYVWSYVDYGKSRSVIDGGIGEINAYRLSAGFVLRLGATKYPPPVQLGCTAQPVNVFPGDPITISAVPANLTGKKKATYVWSTSGGTIAGTEETASVKTAGLATGDYTVTGRVYEGFRPSQQAECTAGFRVHSYEPPTLSCAVSPSTVLSGQPVTITSSGHSPQNRILTYSYTSSAGQLSSTGATATLATGGTTPGAVTITCNVVDDLGKQATATASVTITAPPPPPAPLAQSLCTVTFDRDKKRPVRVDNEAKGCLDEIALTLNRESSSKLVIVGHHDSGEQPEAAAERTLNVKQYLMDEKGVDPSRMELRTGDGDSRSVNNTLLPAGASFDSGSTATFDSSSIQRHGQAYATPKPSTPATKKSSKKSVKPTN